MQYQTVSFGEDNEKIELTLLDNLVEHNLGGMISSPRLNENLAIVVEDNPGTIDYDFACLGFTKKKTAPRIMMKSNFFEYVKRGTPEGLMILFHEIGHYANNDMLTNEGNADAEREAFVAENKVIEKEIKADDFAAFYLGKEAVITGLNALKKRILVEYADYDEESIRIAVKEIDIRISYIKKMED